MVGDQHIALRFVDVHAANGCRHGIGIAGDLGVRKKSAHMGRFDEGQHIHIHRAVFIAEGDGLYHAVIHRCQMNAGCIDQAVGKRKPLGGIVVAADDENRQLALSQPHQKIIKQLHSLGGRNRFIIHITGDQHTVRIFFVNNGKDLFQNMRLVFQHGKLVYSFSEMNVRKMDQFHGLWCRNFLGHFFASFVLFFRF